MESSDIESMMQSEIFVVLTVLILALGAGLIMRSGHQVQKVGEGEVGDSIARMYQPMLFIPDLENQHFESGKAYIKPDLRSELNKAITEWIPVHARSGFDRIEVIGHADTEEVRREKPPINADKHGERILNNSHENNIGKKLHINSNIELGMMRALNVVNYLRSHRCNPEDRCNVNQVKSQAVEQSLLANIVEIRAYSAGQYIPVNRETVRLLKGESNPGRRRIEIRLTRSR